jgi:cephalosporin-C deacetylase
MPFFDLPLADLEAYRPTLAQPNDVDEFWSQTLSEAEAFDLNVRSELIDTHLDAIATWDITFAGFGGHEIHAWLHLPRHRDTEQLPAVVQFQGYGGGRGLAHESILWVTAGYAHLVVDTRGQGSGWSVGHSADPVGSDPSEPGFTTRGIVSPETYYYRRVFVDAVRAVEVARTWRDIDPSRVAVCGVSQGGGLSLAAAALGTDVGAVLADVPFLCHISRAIEITDCDPYAEIARYLRAHRDKRETVLRTLSYFDCAALAPRASAPALFSVALMDETCPPSTIYAAYNAYGGPKEICVYHYNYHEGGGAIHQARQLAWLSARFRKA